MNLFVKLIYWMPLVTALFIAIIVHGVFFLVFWGTVVGSIRLLDYAVAAVIAMADIFAIRLFWRVYVTNARAE